MTEYSDILEEMARNLLKPIRVQGLHKRNARATIIQCKDQIREADEIIKGYRMALKKIYDPKEFNPGTSRDIEQELELLGEDDD